jgi:hypothetical protein
MQDGVGPYSGIQLITVARGLAAAQQYLRRGWTLISSQFCEELIEGGTGTRRQIRKHELYSVFGRGFVAEAQPDEQEEARVLATEEGEDSLADGQSVTLVPPDDDDAEPVLATSLRVPTGADADAEADLAQAPRPRTVRRGTPARREPGYKPVQSSGPGETEATGLPNAR